MRLISVDLPLPVLPMMAVVWPGSAVNEMSRRMGCSAPGIAELDVAELDARAGTRWCEGSLRHDVRCPETGASVTGATGSTIVGSVSRTSRMRPADTTARGRKMIMKTAISTEKRICIR